MSEAPRIALVGMGGYAADHHRTVQHLERRGVLRLVCTCDTRRAAYDEALENWCLAEREVSTYDDFERMLDRETASVDILCVATPIPQHEAMHLAGVRRGLAVYLEKPPTLDPRALSSMIALDDTARHRTLVGFNFILEPARRRLKRRLLAGDFGDLLGLSFCAVWPRPEAYFRRAAWAGRLLAPGGGLVLDSCLGNATSHFSHNLLFWSGGPALDSWGRPDHVEAQLYRAHDIQGADTFFVRGTTERQTPFHIAVTHAGKSSPYQLETVDCEHAKIAYDAYGSVRIHWKNGRVETIEREVYDPLQANYLDYVAYLSGEKSRPHTTLRDSEPLVLLNALSYLSSQRIHAFPAELVTRAGAERKPRDGQRFRAVRGLERALEDFVLGANFPRFGVGEDEVRRVARPDQLEELDACVGAMANEASLAASARD